MRTRNAMLVRTIADMSYSAMGMYPYNSHESLAHDIAYEVGRWLGVPTEYLDSPDDGSVTYQATFLVRIGNHSILVPRLFPAESNRDAMFKARSMQALLFPGGSRVDDNGVYFFSGGEVAVKLEKLVILNPFNLTVDESLPLKEVA